MTRVLVAAIVACVAAAPRASHLAPLASHLAPPVSRLPSRAPRLAQGVFKSGVDGVTVVVSVRSGNRPVVGLSAADFEVRDNGVPQAITSMSAGKVPLNLTLLLDSSSSVDGPTLQRLKTAVRDTAALLGPDDRIRLVTVSQALHQVFSFRAPGVDLVLDGLTADGATALYDGIAATMMRPAQPGNRHLVVAFTDGRDSASILEEKTVKEIARLTDAVVDIVVPVAGPEDPATRRLAQRNTVDSLMGAANVTNVRSEPQAGAGVGAGIDGVPPVLSDLVAPTGGRVISLRGGDSISRVFKTVLEDFRASYVIQYVAEGVAAEGWHELTVTVKKRPKYDIRARKGYLGRSKIGSSEASR